MLVAPALMVTTPLCLQLCCKALQQLTDNGTTVIILAEACSLLNSEEKSCRLYSGIACMVFLLATQMMGRGIVLKLTRQRLSNIACLKVLRIDIFLLLKCR